MIEKKSLLGLFQMQKRLSRLQERNSGALGSGLRGNFAFYTNQDVLINSQRIAQALAGLWVGTRSSCLCCLHAISMVIARES